MLLYSWQLHPQALKAIRRLAHVQRALLVYAFQDMSSLAAERVKKEYVSESIAKVVQCITCAAGASTMQSLATSLTRFAKTVSISVAIAQAAALVVTTHARGIGVTDLLHGLGAISGRQGHRATIVVKVKTRLSILLSVAIAQDAAVVVTTHARGIGVTDLLHGQRVHCQTICGPC